MEGKNSACVIEQKENLVSGEDAWNENASSCQFALSLSRSSHQYFLYPSSLPYFSS